MSPGNDVIGLRLGFQHLAPLIYRNRKLRFTTVPETSQNRNRKLR